MAGVLVFDGIDDYVSAFTSVADRRFSFNTYTVHASHEATGTQPVPDPSPNA